MSNRRRRNTRRSKRPTDRQIAVDSYFLSPETQDIVYTYTASDPCTATNFSLDISADNTALVWALAYVPDGYSANLLTPNQANVNAYEPSKNVLLIGTGEPDLPVRSRYSRKMAAGDSIVLIILNQAQQALYGTITLSFTTVH